MRKVKRPTAKPAKRRAPSVRQTRASGASEAREHFMFKIPPNVRVTGFTAGPLEW